MACLNGALVSSPRQAASGGRFLCVCPGMQAEMSLPQCYQSEPTSVSACQHPSLD